MNLFPPNVDAIATTVQLGDSVAFRNLFEASDLDGNPIQTLRFRDNGGAASSGFFTVRGVKQSSNIFIQVDISELDFIRYHSALIEGNETFSVQVGDGQRLSQIDTAVANTIRQNFFAPTVTPIPGSVLATERIEASTLFSVSDPENNPILRYFFVDSLTNANGGHFLLDGVRQESGVFFLVEADQLDQLSYVGGKFGQSEQIGISAFDGEFWSSIVNVAVTTTPNLTAPVVNVFNVNSPLDRTIDAESLFTFTDADGNTPKTFGFLDTGTNPNSGFFTVNGIRQDAGSYFFIEANRLDTVRYQVSDSSDSEVFRVFATDGQFASAVKSGTVTAIPRPQIDVDNFEVVVDTLQRVDFVDLITQVDNGPALNTFQVIDQNEDAISAKLSLNGQVLEAGVLHTLTALEFANLEIQGGFADDRTADQFLVRGANALFFTEWREFRVSTVPELDGALTSGTRFSQLLDDGQKTRITYTFIEGFDFTDPDNTTPPVPSYYPDDDDVREDPFPLDNTMRAGVRAGLDIIESYADIEFVEVPFTIDAADASITFGLTRGGPEDALGFTQLTLDGFGLGNSLSDIWFNRDAYPEFATPAGPGTDFFVTAIHEIGHTLGFKHPFQAPNNVPILLDNNLFSVMSGPNIPGVINAGFALYDIFEVQRLYRPNDEFNLGNDHYFFTNPGNLVTVYDAGGRDTFNLTSSLTDEFIDLREGAFSSLNGNPFASAIAYGTVIENARGGGGADTIVGNFSRNLLFGNGNADILEGDGGNDVLRGGAGGDTYVWRTGDGRDSIDEQQQGGVDSIDIFDDTALNSLENDFVFRRFGRDLRIDLRFDRNEGQGSLVIKDQQFGGSKIETLRLFATNGEQIGQDIDLDSIFQQADTSAQFFRLTNQQTENGFIAVPFV